MSGAKKERFKFNKHKCPFCARNNSISVAPTQGGCLVLRCKCGRCYYLTWLGSWDGIGNDRQNLEMDYAKKFSK